ncbi:MAG: hypothetical protein V4449_04000 [Patescibacteria group bacterium]
MKTKFFLCLKPIIHLKKPARVRGYESLLPELVQSKEDNMIRPVQSIKAGSLSRIVLGNSGLDIQTLFVLVNRWAL